MTLWYQPAEIWAGAELWAADIKSIWFSSFQIQLQWHGRQQTPILLPSWVNTACMLTHSSACAGLHTGAPQSNVIAIFPIISAVLSILSRCPVQCEAALICMLIKCNLPGARLFLWTLSFWHLLNAKQHAAQPAKLRVCVAASLPGSLCVSVSPFTLCVAGIRIVGWCKMTYSIYFLSLVPEAM